jgi:hypothetical protein
MAIIIHHKNIRVMKSRERSWKGMIEIKIVKKYLVGKIAGEETIWKT